MSKILNTICITWHIEDVKSLDHTLTDQQARDILQSVRDQHDANIGINWDVINACIRSYKDDNNL